MKGEGGSNHDAPFPSLPVCIQSAFGEQSRIVSPSKLGKDGFLTTVCHFFKKGLTNLGIWREKEKKIFSLLPKQQLRPR